MDSQKKLSAKQFIRQKKLNMKNIRSRQGQTQKLLAYIQSGQTQDFSSGIQKLQKLQILQFLFSEDSMKTTPLFKILSSPKMQSYLEVVSRNLQREYTLIQENICSKWATNQFVQNDWKNKFIALNRAVIKQIFLSSSQGNRKHVSESIIEFISEKNNFISDLYLKFLTFDCIQSILSINLNNKNLQGSTQTPDMLYIPLCRKLYHQGKSTLQIKLEELKSSILKQKIWRSQDFLQAIKDNQLNQFNFQLKQLNINFMHQMFQKQENLSQIFEVHQLLQNSEQVVHQKLFQKVYSMFNANGQTPVDVALRKWSFQSLGKLVLFIRKNLATIQFSTSSLNALLINKKLSQAQKQQFLQEILSPQYSSAGYVDMLKVQQHVRLKKTSQNPVDVYLPSSQTSSLVVYDSNSLVSKKDKNNSFPLLTYLQQFKQNSNLKIVEKLFINQVLNRKNVKLKIMTIIKSFWNQPNNPIVKDGFGQKQIQKVLSYQIPLTTLICRIKPCDCNQYLLNKIFINFPSLILGKKDSQNTTLIISRHFLVIYLENAYTLEQNQQNKLILEKIFNSKDTQKFIGDKYNVYVQILKGLNQSSAFHDNKKDYLLSQVRRNLRQYFKSLPTQFLFESSYFKELSCYFFRLKLQKKNKQTYQPDKDWSLFSIDQLCELLKEFNFSKYIKKKHQSQQEIFQDIEEHSGASTPMKEQEQEQDDQSQNYIQRMKIARLLLSQLGKGQKQQQYKMEQDILDEYDLQWIKTSYRKCQTLMSLQNYANKIKAQLSKPQHPSSLKTEIQVSLHQPQLEQKIHLLIKQAFDFYFSRFQMQKLRLKQHWVTGVQSIVEDLAVGDQTLRMVVRNMIQCEMSFVTALIYNQRIDVGELKRIIGLQNLPFLQVILAKFQERKNSRHGTGPQFTYPQTPAHPIPFNRFLTFKNLVQQFKREQSFQARQDKSQILQFLSIQNLFQNFLRNLDFQYSQIGIRSDGQLLEGEGKSHGVEKLMQVWQLGHQWTKEHFDFKSRISKLISGQLQIQKEKNKDSSGQFEQIDIEQKTLPIRQLSDYYHIIGEQFLLKHHNNPTSLNFIIKTLTVEQIFLIDKYIANLPIAKAHNRCAHIMLVYKMQVSEDPFKVFRDGIEIQPLLGPLNGKKRHAHIRNLFIQQLKRFSEQQFRLTLPQMQVSKFMGLGDIMHQIVDEDRRITLLEYILKSDNQSLKKLFTPKYLVSLINQNAPRLSICLLLLVLNQDCKFWFAQQTDKGRQVFSYTYQSFFVKCNVHTFEMVIKTMKQYYIKANDLLNQQQKRSKLKSIISILAAGQSWTKIARLLNQTGFANMQLLVQQSFQSIGKNILSCKKSVLDHRELEPVFKGVIQKLFQTYKELEIPFNQQTFISAYMCDPVKAFDIIKPLSLNVYGFVGCLKYAPEHAQLFLASKVQVSQTYDQNTQKQPDLKYFKSAFPLTPYYSQKFRDSSWLLDLLRVQKKILEATNHSNLLDKTMQSLILLDEMQQSFREFYPEQQIMLKCKKILTSPTITSLKKYPHEWFTSYFKKNKFENLQILNSQLLIELIEAEYIQKQSLFQVISTCKLNVVKHFCQKYKLKIDYAFLKQMQAKYRLNKFKDRTSESKLFFWDYLTQINNQAFVIELIKTYDLLDLFPVQQYDKIILHNIAFYKRLSFLPFFIDYLAKKADKKLQFAFNMKGKIWNYLIIFPSEIAITTNFYQYYFLVRSSGNQCPDFYTSNRYLIRPEDNLKELQKLMFVPQLKKRLQILSILSSCSHPGLSGSFQKQVLMKNLLSIKNKPAQQSQQLEVEQSKHRKWQDFLTYLVQPSIQIFRKQSKSTLVNVLVLFITHQKTGIQLKQIQRLYPLQFQIVRRVQAYINKQIDVFQYVRDVISKESELKVIVLKNNFQFFMHYFDFWDQLGHRASDILIYAKGVLMNLQRLQTNHKYKPGLEKFISACFCWQQKQSYLKVNHHTFLKKNIFQFILVSLCEGNGFSMDVLKNVLDLKQQTNGSLLLLTAAKVNQVTVNRTQIPSFDLRAWTNIIQECCQVNFDLNQNRSEIDLEAILQQSMQSLNKMIDQKFKLKVNNLRQLITQAYQKAQSALKQNIFVIITILINQIYIFCSLNELYTQISSSFKSDDNLSLQIQFTHEQFSIQTSHHDTLKIYFKIPYGWTAVKMGIPLIDVDMHQVLKRSSKQILIQNLIKGSSIKTLTDKYANNAESSFKGLEFFFDPESFKKVKNSQSLSKLVECSPLTDNGISTIQKVMYSVDDKVFNEKQIKYYSLSDVFGPIKLSDQNINTQKVTSCMTFYQLIHLPSKKVTIQFINQKPTHQQTQSHYIIDFQRYTKYFLNEALDSHPIDANQYGFQSKIQLYMDQEKMDIMVFMHRFSLFNILKCLSLINSSSDQIRRLFQNRIDVRFNASSIIQLHKHILDTKTQNREYYSTYKFISSFLKQRQHNQLIEKVLLMIIQDAINIMKVVKGTLISYEICQDVSDAQKLFKIHEFVFVDGIGYSIDEQILNIRFRVYIQKDGQDDRSSCSLCSSGLTCRKRFLSSIFCSTQFLVDYFLHKQILNNESVNISRHLTTKLNNTINLHLNYRTLQNFIDKIKDQFSISQIQGYLTSLLNYLLINMQTKLIEYSMSRAVMDRHQIMLLNTFEYLNNCLSKGINVDPKEMETQIRKIDGRKQLVYSLEKSHNDRGLQLLQGYSQQVQNLDDNAKNVFLIQIYKNSFTSLVSEGTTFIVGFKASNKNPTLIKFVRRQDIDKVNLVDIAYLLLVSTYIPTHDQLNRSKIIRVLVSDLHKNIYRISDPVKDYLLSLKEEDAQLRSITSLIPVISSNIAIDFLNQELIDSSLAIGNVRNCKVFQVKLQKQPQFRLKPSDEEPIQLLNHLKKDHVFIAQINQFIKDLQSHLNQGKFKLKIDSSLLEKTIAPAKLAHIVRLALFDINQAITMLFAQPLRNTALQTSYSIKQRKSIKQSIFIQLRKQTFHKYFESLRIIISNTLKPHLRIEGNQIVLEISLDAEIKFVRDMQIVYKILQYMVKSQIQLNKQRIRVQIEELIQNQSPIILLRILDIITTLEIQLSQIQKAKLVYQTLNITGTQPKKPFKSYKALIQIVKGTKSKLICLQSEEILQLNLNIDKSENEFFSSTDTLNFLINDFQQSFFYDSMSAHYQIKDKTVHFQGIVGKELVLVIEDNQKTQTIYHKIDIQNSQNRLVQLSDFLKQLKTKNSVRRFWAVDLQNKFSYDNYIYDLSQQSSANIITKKTSSKLVNQPFSLYVSNKDIININTCPITMSVLPQWNNGIHTYRSILRDVLKQHYEIYMISKQTAEIRLSFYASAGVSMVLGSYVNMFDPEVNQTYKVTISSDSQAVIENTRFIQLHFRNKVYRSKELKSNDNNKKNIQNQLCQPVQKASIKQQEDQILDKAKKTISVESLVYVVNNESKYYLTRAGQERVDYILTCDADFNAVQLPGQINVYFKHVNNLCKIVPGIIRKGLRIGLVWTPTIRGHYKVYINSLCLNPEYEIGVCAAVADLSHSNVEQPKTKKICYAEQTQVTLNLKDIYGNIYTQLQQSILGDGLIIDIDCNIQKLNKCIQKKEEPINKYGIKTVKFSFNDLSQSQSIQVIVTVSMNNESMCVFQMKIEGQSLQQRRKNLQTQINNMSQLNPHEITVSRDNFLEDLFRVAEKNMFCNFRVKFAGEQGIDAGGLKRQFYDMIGQQIKNQKNPFFKAIDNTKTSYFMNSQLLKNKKKQTYMQLFGKYLANSILNGYLIGVNFSQVLIKLLYEDQVQFQDLLLILPEEQAKMYQYLTSAPQEDFQDLQIYFTVMIDKKKQKFVQLKQNGANIQVTKLNVTEYLELLPKALIKDKYQQLIQAFRKGFKLVIPLETVRKWIKPRQFWSLTQGIKQINAEIVLSYINFGCSADQAIISWFRRYIKEASLEVLTGFLKFTTGSSSIDFDQASKVVVTFESAGSNPKKLPISHTCWKQIVIPKYKTYQIMHKLLNTAFIFCCEGFGFG